MRGFTDAELEQIYETLRETGRELFGRYGVRKTTIAELTEPTRIATGSFYEFYDFKEDLYIDILETESEELIPRVLGASLERHDDPEKAIAALLDLTMEEVESNPLIRRLIVEDELDRVRSHISGDEQESERDPNVAYFLPYIEQWYDDGRVAGPDPETIAHAIRSVVYLTLHIKEIGEDRYPVVRDTIIAAIAAGLTDGTELMEDAHD